MGCPERKGYRGGNAHFDGEKSLKPSFILTVTGPCPQRQLRRPEPRHAGSRPGARAGSELGAALRFGLNSRPHRLGNHRQHLSARVRLLERGFRHLPPPRPVPSEVSAHRRGGRPGSRSHLDLTSGAWCHFPGGALRVSAAGGFPDTADQGRVPWVRLRRGLRTAYAWVGRRVPMHVP